MSLSQASRTLSGGDSLSTKLLDQRIGHHPRVADIAIREAIDLRDAMVQPHGNFIWRESLVLEPETRVLSNITGSFAQRESNLRGSCGAPEEIRTPDPDS